MGRSWVGAGRVSVAQPGTMVIPTRMVPFVPAQTEPLARQAATATMAMDLRTRIDCSCCSSTRDETGQTMCRPAPAKVEPVSGTSASYAGLCLRTVRWVTRDRMPLGRSVRQDDLDRVAVAPRLEQGLVVHPAVDRQGLAGAGTGAFHRVDVDVVAPRVGAAGPVEPVRNAGAVRVAHLTGAACHRVQAVVESDLPGRALGAGQVDGGGAGQVAGA